jgi:protein-S-isoprenylcysteine O-methyltransferase Ste14
MKSPVLISLAAALYALVHSLLATLGAKARARQWFGPAADRWYRLAYNLFAGLSFTPILALLLVLPDRELYTIPLPWTLFTSAGQLAGAVIIVLGIWQTGAWSFLGLRQVVAGPRPEGQPQLVVRGLYRWMRHPLYTGGLLLIWLLPVMTANILTLNVILTAYLIVGAKLEEGRLLHEFGAAYAQYQQQVPMLIPKLPREDKQQG